MGRSVSRTFPIRDQGRLKSRCERRHGSRPRGKSARRLTQLTESDRALVHLFYFEQLRLAEIIGDRRGDARRAEDAAGPRPAKAARACSATRTWHERVGADERVRDDRGAAL